ncbi:hypothetical protein M8J77_011685 [Diaphorina citri]|nr:hypothetical protein M8J77_011685 [Diaphorina citri]
MVMKKLNELTCKELIAELKTRGISSSGPKAELTARLEEALRAEGLVPDEVTFDELSDGGKKSEEGEEKTGNENLAAMISSLAESMKTFNMQTAQSIQSVNERIDSTSKQTIEIVNKQTADVVNDRTNEMKEAFTSEIGETNNRVLELQSSVQAQISMFQVEVDKVKGDMHVLEDRFKGMEDKVDSVDDRVRNFEDKLAEMSNNITRQVIGQVVQHPPSSLSTVIPERANPARMKPPVFDGQMAWSIFKRQFEAACECNLYSAKEKVTALMLSLRGPAADLIQTLPKDSNLTYDELVSVIERRFGDEHMQDVYRIQLRNRMQKSGESLQELHADIERLAYLSYSHSNPELLNLMAYDAFVNAIADPELQLAVRLAGKKTTPEALAYALTFEAAKQASRTALPVRRVTFSDEAAHHSTSDRRNEKDENHCWHCNTRGHSRRDCKKRNYSAYSLKCWTCGARGHIQSDCRKRRRFETFLSRPTTRSETREKLDSPSQSSVERYSDVEQKRKPETDNPVECGQVQPSSCPENIHVRSVRGMYDSLIIRGKVNQRNCNILIDTAAVRSIMRRDILAETNLKNPDKYTLKTATGEQSRVYGEIEVTMQLGNVEMRHTFVVADIVDDCILGFDFMMDHGVSMDFGDSTMVIGSAVIPMTVGSIESCNALRTAVNETLPPPSEFIECARDRDVPARSKPTVEPKLNHRVVRAAKTSKGVADQDKKETNQDVIRPKEENKQDVQDRSRDKSKVSRDRMKTGKECKDVSVDSVGFKEGDLVWLYNPKRRKGHSPKLQQNWEGPYNVITRINDVVYRIRKGSRGKFKVVHLDRLAPYLEPNLF